MNRSAASYAESPLPWGGMSLLLRLKACGLKNHLLEALRAARLKILSAAAAVLLIWFGLYKLFYEILKVINEDTLRGIVAVPLMLDFFFVALMVMLAFSNGIISYGGLFAKGEPAFLLCRPVPPTSVALLKFLESLFFSSWSLILIGLPLMVSLAQLGNAYLPWFYYPLFMVFFLFFIPIPGAVGLIVAWGVGYWFSKIARPVLCIILLVVASGAAVWVWNMITVERMDTTIWLNDFFDRASLIQGTFWPSRWVSTGLHYARSGELASALFYLLLTFSNALFFSWLAVKIVGWRLLSAYDRVQASGHQTTYNGRYTRLIAGILFWYLPAYLREITLKDLRTFLRDPTQWSQLMILLALLSLYVINIPNVALKIETFQSQLLVSFLNVAAISLILATFTGRFVFPLISLEAQQLWFIGLVPMPRGRLLLPKFVFALTITMATGSAVMLLAMSTSEISAELIAIDMITILAVCVGLCGMAVGLGARFPMVKECNPAKIANGLGGTINLIASIAMVAAMLSISVVMGLRFRNLDAVLIDQTTVALIFALVLLGVLAGGIPMLIGRRYFSRLEF